MHFTQEDYRKIESWLNQRGIKDSELDPASKLNGDEKVAILQDGENRVLPLNIFISKEEHDALVSVVNKIKDKVNDISGEEGPSTQDNDINNLLEIAQFLKGFDPKDNLIEVLEGLEEGVYDSINDIINRIGKANGIAPLDENGVVPSAYLPSYVDDVLEFNSLDDFPAVGEVGKIYVTLDTNLTYRWTGSQYIEISKSLGLGETSGTAYPGDKGKEVADNVDILLNDMLIVKASPIVSLTIGPSVIYKNVSTEVTITSTFTSKDNSLVPKKISISDGVMVLNAKNNTSTVSFTDSVKSTKSATSYEGIAELDPNNTGRIIYVKGTGTLYARYPIYAGFGTTPESIAIDDNKLSARVSAEGTYNYDCTEDGQSFFILVPNDIPSLSNFTMGGAPFVMDTTGYTVIDSVAYQVCKSGSVYNTGANVNIKATR